MKLFLFDIDGTLINSGGSGQKAANIVFEKYFHIKNGFSKVQLRGRSDTAIWNDVINNFKIPQSEYIKLKPVLFREYYKTLKKVIISADKKELLPNVKETIRYIIKKEYKLGLITGNLKQGAYIKINAFDLGKFFPVGGFGNDSGSRDIIAKKAISRAKKFYNFNFSNDNIYIIGDTPADIQCALNNNVIAVAVATGKHSIEELKKYNPHYTLKNLNELKNII